MPNGLRRMLTVRHLSRTDGVRCLTVTGTLGLMLFVLVHAAGIQDRDGAVDLVKAIRHRFPWLRHLFADGGYAGDKLETALAELGRWTLEIVKRPDAAEGFVVLPRRRVVERTFAWLARYRRLTIRYEHRADIHLAFTTLACALVCLGQIKRFC